MILNSHPCKNPKTFPRRLHFPPFKNPHPKEGGHWKQKWFSEKLGRFLHVGHRQAEHAAVHREDVGHGQESGQAGPDFGGVAGTKPALVFGLGVLEFPMAGLCVPS